MQILQSKFYPRVRSWVVWATVILLGAIFAAPVHADGPVQVQPAPNSQAVRPDTTLTITLGSAITQTVPTSRTVPVHGSYRGRLAGTYSHASQTIGFDPAQNLLPGELVQATVVTSVVAGSTPLTRSAVWQFKAAVQPSSGIFTDTGQALGTDTSYSAALGDADSDGDLDVFIANLGAANKLWLNDGAGNLTDSGLTFGSTAYWVRVADVNGDGKLDALFSNNVWLGDGAGGFTPTGQGFGTGDAFADLGDVDGDGDLDLLIVFDFVASNLIMLNDGHGTFINSGQSLSTLRAKTGALGDVDGDGDLDAVLALDDYSAGKVWFNDGTGLFTQGSQSFYARLNFVALIDVNGDGNLDIFSQITGSSNRILVNNGDGVFGNGQTLNYPSMTFATFGDVDGDGDQDALVTQSWGEPNKILFNTNGGFFDNGSTLGAIRSNGAALGDLNGDGDLDAVIVTGQFSPQTVWRNQNLADMTVRQTVDTQVAASDQLLHLTLTFTNAQASAAANVVITDVIPSALSVQQVNITADVPLTQTTVVTNIARAGTDTPESIRTNNADALPVTIYPMRANDMNLVTDEDFALTGTLSVDNPNGLPLTFSLVSTPSMGVASITNMSTGEFVYTPTHRSRTFYDSFTFKTNDGSEDSNVATVSIRIVADADPGELDDAFSDDGMVITAFSGNYMDTIDGLGLQSDGTIVAAGTSKNQIALARYSSAGVLLGKTVTPLGPETASRGYAVAVQPDDKIIIAGSGSGDFAVFRYTANGVLDTTFSADGKAFTDFGAANGETAHAVALQPDGRIVAGGFVDYGIDERFALARYTASGALDTSFGISGTVTTGFTAQ